MKTKKSSLLGVLLSVVMMCVLAFGTLAVLATNADRDIDYENQYPMSYDATPSVQVTDVQIPSQSYEGWQDGFYQLDYEQVSPIHLVGCGAIERAMAVDGFVSVVGTDDGVSAIHSLIESYAVPQSPYRIARTLEEVRAIIALQDGTIPITNIDVPEIINRQANGIIVTEQCLYEALEILVDVYLHNSYYGQSNPVTNFVTTRFNPLSSMSLDMGPRLTLNCPNGTPSPIMLWEIEPCPRLMKATIEMGTILRNHFGLGENEGNWAFGGDNCLDTPIVNLTVYLYGRDRFYEVQVNRETGEVFNINPTTYPHSD